jgi:hypothetical protein
MLKKILLALVAVIVIGIAALLIYLNNYGFFSKVTIIEKDMGPLTIVYVPVKGDYAKTSGPASALVYNRLKNEFNISCEKGIGIYYDSPQTTKPEDRRSDMGCLLEGNDALKADTVMKKMRVKIFYKKKYITAEFPLKGMMSYMFSPMKVYPELNKYMAAKGYKTGPAIEIYDMPGKKIITAFERK